MRAGDVGAWAWHADGQMVFLCPTLRRMLGYDENDESAPTPRAIWQVHQADIPTLERAMTAQIAGGQEPMRVDCRVRHRDGSYRWLMLTGRRKCGSTVAQVVGAAVDVTCRKHDELTRTQMLTAIEAASDAVGIADTQGRILYLNPAGARLMGVAEETDLSSTRIPDYHPPWAADLVMRDGLCTAEKHGTWQGETAVFGPSGEAIPVWQVIVAHRTAEGGVDFYSTIMRDLTERRQIERRLQQAQEQLETRVAERTAELERMNTALQAQVAERRQAEQLLQQSQARLAEAHRIARLGNWEWDIPSNALRWSDEVYRIFGLSREKWASTYDRFLESVHPADREMVEAAVAQALESDDNPYNIHHRIVRPDGTVRTVQEQGELTRDEHGRPVRMTGTVQDVTEQTRAENALRAIVRGTAGATAENFFELLVEHLSIALDVRYVIVGQLASWSNAGPRMETLAVWSRGSLAENFDYDISEGPCQFITERREFHCDDHLQQMFPQNRRLVAMDAQSCVGVPLLGSGEKVVGVLLAFNDKPVANLSVAMPIMRIFAVRAAAEIERMMTEQRARQRERELAHAARLNIVGTLAAGLAHELNQPLCSIANYTRSSIRRLSAGDADKAELLEDLSRAASQAERAGEIIRKLKAFIADRPPHKSPIDLREVLDSAVHLVAVEARHRGVKLVIDVPPTLARIAADEVQLEQVVLNLIQNAMEAMKDTPSHQRVITLGVVAHEKQTEVFVRDQGPGLPPKHLGQVFNSFFTTRTDGLGLGLSISRSIVEAHHGCLWAENNADRGSTFRFMVPLK